MRGAECSAATVAATNRLTNRRLSCRCAVAGLEALHLWGLFMHRPAWDAALHHSQLTCLDLQLSHWAQGEAHWAGSQLLRVLPALQHLEISAQLDEEGQAPNLLPCLQLAGCSRLTSLALEQCGLTELPPGLATVSALQRCRLVDSNLRRAQRWPDLTLLHQLTDLELCRCLLDGIPAPLSCLTALRRL